MGCINTYHGMNYYIAFSRERKCNTRYFDPLFWVYMITLPFVQPTIMTQFLIILSSLSHKNPPLNINLPLIFIFLIFYVIFNPSHPHMIDCRVYRLHMNKISNKQVTKRHVCRSVQRRVHVFKATIWSNDKIFKVNIYNNRNGCTFIIRFLCIKMTMYHCIISYHVLFLSCIMLYHYHKSHGTYILCTQRWIFPKNYQLSGFKLFLVIWLYDNL
jgi:hypothetical protein